MPRFILLILSIFLIAQSTYSSEEPFLRQKRRAFVPFFLNRPTPHPDPQYRLNIETGTYKRQEMSDGHGNIKGRYTYWNEGGEHTVEYFAGQDARYLSAAMTLPLADRPVVPKYFFIPRHIYPCTTDHSKQEHGELNVEPLPSTESSTSTSTPTPSPMGGTEASTGQSPEENPTTIGSSETTSGSSETTVGSSEATTVAP